MNASYQLGLGNIFKMDRCRRYFPRYDEQTFLQEINYTQGQLIEYLPQRFVEEYEGFKKAGNVIKVGFWIIDIAFVSFCHKIKLLSKILGSQSWKMFAFKIAAIGFPLSFIDSVEEDAINQFNKGLYTRVNKFYKRYKQTGDILDLNINIILEDKQTQLQKICHLNEFNLAHGVNIQNINQNLDKVI